MPVSSKTTVAQSVFHNFHLKQPIEVASMLLNTHTNLGKFTVARSVLHNFTFLTKNVNFKQFVDAHFLFHKHGKFKEISKFLA